MGPLSGIKVLEFEAIGPGPFAGMLLADMGADVLVVDRPASTDLGLKRERWYDVMMRGKRSVVLDLKKHSEHALELIGRADALIEGFRPGVMERLGLGPDVALARNPKLVYGRMTGWGQDGPLAPRAGHDINYIALAGVLHAFGRRGEAPVPPLNLVGDFGGGGMLLGFGIACALLEAGRSGKGQVVDAAMVEGASLLAAMFSGFLAAKSWSEERGVNVLDTGAPWYDVYETKDGKHVAIGAIEAKFYEELLSRLGLRDVPPQHDRTRWPELRVAFTQTFKAKTRDEWCRVFEGSDACFAPVLSFSEARDHTHNRAREAFLEVANVKQPAPAPRFSRTPGTVRRPPPERGEGGLEALRDWGFSSEELHRWQLGKGASAGAVGEDEKAASVQAFRDYVAAFQSLDAKVVAPFYHEPLMVFTTARAGALSTRADIEGWLAPVFARLKERNYARSDWSQLHAQVLAEGIVVISTQTVRYRKDGQELEKLGFTYLLRRTIEGWKVAVIVGHDPANVLRLG